MNNNQKPNYRLVARISGHQLTISEDVGRQLATCYDERIDEICRRTKSAEERARVVARELEHKGDFLADCGHNAAAARCYIKASQLLRHPSDIRRVMDKAELCARRG